MRGGVTPPRNSKGVKVKSKSRFIRFFSLIVCLLSGITCLWAGTSGKLAGRVTDAQTGEALPFANIIVEETTLGDASDLDGFYVILNVPPGTYAVTAKMMGYQEVKITNIKVAVDFTTTMDFAPNPTVIEAEGITVVAERELIQMDLTSTRAVVDAERIDALPVEGFQDLVNLQAGVVEGHIRGGRSSEVVYMLDGISITDPFSHEAAVDVENSVIQELQVISGTFNAEYGQAMSGVVNIVTREGGNKLSGRITTYTGDYVSNHTETYMNIDHINPFSTYNIETTLGGPFPIFGKKLSFYATARRYYNEGYLFGKRIFNASDSCDFSKDNPDEWYIGATGDSSMVPMAPTLKNSLYGKFTYRLSPGDRFSYNLMWKSRDFRAYDHTFKYNPDGDYNRYDRGYSNIFNWNHVINSKTFFELKFANSFHDYRQYIYKDSLDKRYVDPERLQDASNYAFRTGGTQMRYFCRNTTSYIGKFDITSQVTNTHQIKLGVELRKHKLFLHEFEIVPKKDEVGREIHPFEPYIPPINYTNHNKYTNYPFEVAAYIQDKIEVKNMIANIGVRFDYFDPYWKIPTDPRDPNPKDALHPDTLNPYDPGNPIRVTGEPWFEDVEPRIQISPRIGIAYPITDRGVLHGSYGHFFQIPPFEYIYTDPEFEVYAAGLTSRMGNADLEPQKTVIYEIGLQQQLSDNISLDVTGFFKNIRNLLGIRIYETYIGSKYAQYINRDYGNVRGITVALEGRYSQYLYASLDYTYQIAKGNASDPNAVFWDVLANREPEKFLVPLDWDQMHTLNGAVTIGYSQFWGVSLIGRYGTGLPYTPSHEGIRIARENSERKPPQYNVDLRAYYNLKLIGSNFSLFLKVYNLFDIMNEVNVYTDTGRAGYTLISSPGVVRGINTLEEYLIRPDFYCAPRHVILGFSVDL
ncbi:hypothetical protein CH333_02740 [candidate division WOR-3 bacterium JGI_Cruoil_03_44_89]|uniref:Uncharacterized protein n=1 Tax=candidate division WOR-3 bacterium JGI_Cruoil_03_44_89 TaxID=1973748 RepID=A0A235BYB4_UNCW3|nr:MAG: hypothetical protein CH333_02740 [candidate division WOR-3 bacterium JGI_Cruoil_03_44_89]